MKRLFVGIPVSAEVRERLTVLLKELTKSGAELAVVAPENLHFTLKFLGDIPEPKISEISSKLSEITRSQKPFSIGLNRLGAFPTLNYINVIWAGGESPEMVVLMKKVNIALDFYRRERHPSDVPHVTLARVKSVRNQGSLRAFLERKFSAPVMSIEKVVLYASELLPEGPKYTVVKEFPLG